MKVSLANAHPPVRDDFRLIADWVTPGARVLDVGCEDGSLLKLLQRERDVTGRGIELSQAGVNTSVRQGLSVVQGDADKDLGNYPDDAFDYVILSQTIQATQHPRLVLENLLRIGRRAIVSFPNFGYWRMRLHLILRGRMPVTEKLPYSWYDTPNIHFCTIKDFLALCAEMDVVVEEQVAFDANGQTMRLGRQARFANFFGEQAVFLLKRKQAKA